MIARQPEPPGRPPRPRELTLWRVRLRERRDRLLRSAVRGVQRLRGAPAEHGSIVIWPPVHDAGDLADLVARLAWAAPSEEGQRAIVIPVRGMRGADVLTRLEAPAYLLDHPAVPARFHVVSEPREIDRAFARAALLAVRRASALLEPRVAANLHRVTLIDHHFSHSLDIRGWTEIVRRTLPADLPQHVAAASQRNFVRLLDRASGRRVANLFGQGPNVMRVWEHDVSSQLNVICNSMVRDRALLAHLEPMIFASSDPVVFGPSRASMQLREDLRFAARTHDLFFVTHFASACLMRAHFPDLETRLIGVHPSLDKVVPTAEKLQVFPYHNILTQIMIPMALACGPETIRIWGCDGVADPRQRGSSGPVVWPYAASVTYDDLKWTRIRAHPACFRDSVAREYMSHHEAELQEAVSLVEARGVAVECCTPSVLPPLAARFVPPERQEVAASVSTPASRT